MPKRPDVETIGSVPDDVLQVVQSLRAMRCPKFQDESVWPVIVADAIALATADPVVGYSMADRAMSLGWHPLDLFGFDPRWRPWDDWVSLAAWAQGRRVLVIGERTACLSSQEKTPGRYDRLNKRPRLEEIKFLWEL